MNKKSVLESLRSYASHYEEEKVFQSQIINFVIENDDFALRSNLTGQLTASAWVVNEKRNKVLLIHHKKLNRWLQIGGHLEPQDKTVQEAALREIKEESGLQYLKLLSPKIYDIDIHTIPQKNNIAEHLHFDIRFLVEANENEPLIAQKEEIVDTLWVKNSQIQELTKSNQSIRRMTEKMKNISSFISKWPLT